MTDLSVADLAIDPLTPTTLYALTRFRGVFKSMDGGVEWSAVHTSFAENIRFNLLAIDPITPDTLYVGTFAGGVFKSTDGGASWSAVNAGLAPTDEDTIDILVIDTVTPTTLYVLARNQGVSVVVVLLVPHLQVLRRSDIVVRAQDQARSLALEKLANGLDLLKRRDLTGHCVIQPEYQQSICIRQRPLI